MQTFSSYMLSNAGVAWQHVIVTMSQAHPFTVKRFLPPKFYPRCSFSEYYAVHWKQQTWIKTSDQILISTVLAA